MIQQNESNFEEISKGKWNDQSSAHLKIYYPTFLQKQ